MGELGSVGRKEERVGSERRLPFILNPVAVFNKRAPIVIGVDVVEGSLRIGIPIAAVKRNPITNEMETTALGRVYISPELTLLQLPPSLPANPMLTFPVLFSQDEYRIKPQGISDREKGSAICHCQNRRAKSTAVWTSTRGKGCKDILYPPSRESQSIP